MSFLEIVVPLRLLISGCPRFTYEHCRSDNTTKRTLIGKYIAKPDMTLENCAGNCTGYRLVLPPSISPLAFREIPKLIHRVNRYFGVE